MALGTLGASLLWNILAGKEINRAGEGQGKKKELEETANVASFIYQFWNTKILSKWV